eukprot:PhM_4_TR11924/c0_g2_i1/m.23336
MTATPSSPQFTVRPAVAHTSDAHGIVRLTTVVDMTQSKSFVWPADVLDKMISSGDILVVVAVMHSDDGSTSNIDGDDSVVVGVAGVSVVPSWPDTHYTVIPAVVDGTPLRAALHALRATTTGDAVGPYAVCRGLMVDPGHARHGLGGRLHAARLDLA